MRLTSPYPVPDYRSLLIADVVERRLDEISESALMVLIDRNEPERLRTGDGRQHLCRAEHRPRVR